MGGRALHFFLQVIYRSLDPALAPGVSGLVPVLTGHPGARQYSLKLENEPHWLAKT